MIKFIVLSRYLHCQLFSRVFSPSIYIFFVVDSFCFLCLIFVGFRSFDLGLCICWQWIIDWLMVAQVGALLHRDAGDIAGPGRLSVVDDPNVGRLWRFNRDSLHALFALERGSPSHLQHGGLLAPPQFVQLDQAGGHAYGLGGTSLRGQTAPGLDQFPDALLTAVRIDRFVAYRFLRYWNFIFL